MKKSIQLPVSLSLSLILLAQIAFVPIVLSVVFGLMLWAMHSQFKFVAIEFQNRPQTSKSHDHDLALQPVQQTRAHKFRFQLIKFILLGLALLTIYMTYHSFVGVEAGTACLAVFLFAKSLELKNKRDFIILFNFALFVSASLFLYSQSMWMTFMVLVCLVSCVFGLYRLQILDFEPQSPQVLQAFKGDVRHVLKFVGLSLPFFIVLFLFFPRFPPLWHIPIASEQGITGMSDRMSPGDIAELSQSSELAFRVLIDLKQLPAQSALYWRAMVLDHYDGQTWTANERNQWPKPISKEVQFGQGISYQYLPNDFKQRWIMALETSVPNERGYRLNQDESITANRMIQRNQPISLIWLGQDNSISQLRLHPQQYQALASFPQGSDPQAQQLAKQLFKESHYDPELYVKNVIDWYRSHHFVYSLKPGLLGQHRVDEFLFKTKQGFCEHYASSFVLLMRYVGIPARVVIGYQGGQSAPDAQSWEVRQLDAHAWSEVWLNEHWVRVDPTAVIAPQRLNMGMQTYISNDQRVLGDTQFSQFKYQQYALLKNFRIWSDYATFQWQDKVVGYDNARQKKWLSRIGLNSNYAYGLGILFGIVTIGMLYWVGYKTLKYRQQSELQRALSRYSRVLDATQRKQANESFQQWLTRLDAQNEYVQLRTRLNHSYQQIMYLEQHDKETMQLFKKLLKEYTNAIKAQKKTCQKS